MSKYMLGLFLALAGAFSLAYGQATTSAAASQAWVTNYVTRAIAASAGELTATATTATANGVTTITVGEGVLTFETPVDAALVVSATQSAVTNGTTFVWNGSGRYINPVGAITSTATNLVWNGVGAVAGADNKITFAGWFTVDPVLIQPSKSYAITNGVEVAE